MCFTCDYSGKVAISNEVPGSVIGERYRIDEQVGRGGMAIVYRAHDETLGRTVALKVLQGHPTDAAAAQRERSEVALLASLSHPALVTLFDAAEYTVGGEQRTCLIMEYVDGPTLEARISQRPIGRADVVAMATDLAEALDVVHSRGVVHRDIKPANILLGTSRLEGREYAARLADFGIAYLIDSTRITEAGTLIGTAAYLSPEQARGAAPGSSSDIYSLGLVLLEALTGVREFPGSMIESVSARLSRDPLVPTTLDTGWIELLRSMTARDPAARPTAAEVASAVRVIAVTAPSAAAPATTRGLPVSTEVIAPAATELTTTELTTTELTTIELTPTPTQVLPSAAAATERLETERLEAEPAATEVLSSPARATAPHAPAIPPAAAKTSTTTKSSTTTSNRVPAIVVGVIIAVVLVVAAVLIVPRLIPEPTPEQAVPTLPAVDGELGEHLSDLLERVTP